MTEIEMATEQRQPKSQQQLQSQLQRLLRVKEELWEECQPIPPKLLAKIEEVKDSLVEATPTAKIRVAITETPR